MFVGLVTAATLVKTKQVASCFDSDGGLNFTIQGNTTGMYLNNVTYSFNDYCYGNSTLREYSCSLVNGTAYVNLWEENCTCVNGACI